ncbi:UNVERIFIED_CONTAM: MFS family permease [Paenibacillus sp. PvR008]
MPASFLNNSRHFLSPIGGAIADRVNRRNLMMIFDFISSLFVGGLAIFLYSGRAAIILIGVVMTLLSVVSTVYQPTVQASIPVLVDQDDLLKANSTVSGVSAITNFAGPVLGGTLYSFYGINVIIVIACISFFLAAITELFIHMPFEKLHRKYGVFKTILFDIIAGSSYILKGNPRKI